MSLPSKYKASFKVQSDYVVPYVFKMTSERCLRIDSATETPLALIQHGKSLLVAVTFDRLLITSFTGMSTIMCSTCNLQGIAHRLKGRTWDMIVLILISLLWANIN